jgi:hypothetical protein
MSLLLKPKNFNGWQTLVCKEAGIAPYFSAQLAYRVHKRLACNIVVTGEPGIGKSYDAIDLARVCEGRTRDGDNDRFKIDQVVFTYRDFMDLTVNLGIGKAIVFDEPSYAMGKRDWYKDLNKVLVQTIESKRFKIHPLFIPIINKALLDKTIRSYLIQYQVVMNDRGKSMVYRMYPSQYKDLVYRYFICKLQYGLFDKHLCPLESCLGCDKLETCTIFRAQYERKKQSIQDSRYEHALEDASHRESQELSEQEIENLAYQHKDEILNPNGHIDPKKMRLILWEKHRLKIGHNKAYTIKAALEFHHENEFS